MKLFMNCLLFFALSQRWQNIPHIYPWFNCHLELIWDKIVYILFTCTVNMFLRALALVFMSLIRLRFPKNLSFIQVIHNRYDRTLVKLLRKFENLDFKHRKAALNLQFLKTCRDFKGTVMQIEKALINDR